MAVAEAVRIPEVGIFGNGEVLELPNRASLTSLRAIAHGLDTLGRLFDQIQTEAIRNQVLRVQGQPQEEQIESLELDISRAIVDEADIVATPIFALRMALLLTDQFISSMSPEDYHLVVAVATPGEGIEVELEDPALLMHEGSIRFILAAPMSAFLYAGAWCISISRRRGVTRENLAHHMITTLRASAIDNLTKRGAGHLIPEVLDEKTQLGDTDAAVVVLLHGLLSTDVSTFDAFVQGLGAEDNPLRIRVLGWPHDTLAPIASNARLLLRHIRSLLRDKSVPVAFVCHSRGGLLARWAATYATQALGEGVLRGAVTLGTPHEGAAIANYLSSFQLAYFLSIAAAARWKNVNRLADILLYAQQNDGQLPGIRDLKEDTGEESFQSLLTAREAEDAPPRSARSLPLFAVGSNHTARDPKLRWLARSFFGDIPNDLVVSLSSSAPFDAEPRMETACAHSGYGALTEENVARGAIRWVTRILQ